MKEEHTKHYKMHNTRKNTANNFKSSSEKLKKFLRDKQAIHAKIQNGESLIDLKNQGIRFVTPI